MRVRHRYSAVSLILLTLEVIGYCSAASPMAAQQSAPTPAISLEPLPVLPPGTDVRTIWLKLAPPAPKPAPAQVPLAFTGVTVVDVTTGRLHSKQTVVIDGSRIRRIGSSRTVAVPKGAMVVDAAGKYLIPGLWDMHAHVDDRVGTYPFYLANGVTGLREMAPRFPHGADSFRVWQREVMAGTRIGPRSYGPGADITNYNGIDPYPQTGMIDTPARAPGLIDSLKAAGVLFVKYHGGTDDPTFRAILREARRVGLPVVGHLPGSFSAAEASDSGMTSIEHFNNLTPCWPLSSGPDADFKAIEAQCKPVIETLVRNGTWHTPTFGFYDRDLPHQQETVAFAQKFIGLIHSLGMRRFLAGSDGGAVGPTGAAEPGIPSVKEILFLAGAGLTPLEALQAATLNPAKFFHGTDSLGTVAEGKLADLVLLDGNPLADIRNVLKVHAVVANGRYFDEPMLDALAPEARRHALSHAGGDVAPVH